MSLLRLHSSNLQPRNRSLLLFITSIFRGRDLSNNEIKALPDEMFIFC